MDVLNAAGGAASAVLSWRRDLRFRCRGSRRAGCGGSGVAALAHYGTGTFDSGTVNGGNPGLTAPQSGVMTSGGATISTPSIPDADTDGFNVAYGSTAPAPPAS